MRLLLICMVIFLIFSCSDSENGSIKKKPANQKISAAPGSESDSLAGKPKGYKSIHQEELEKHNDTEAKIH